MPKIGNGRIEAGTGRVVLPLDDAATGSGQTVSQSSQQSAFTFSALTTGHGVPVIAGVSQTATAVTLQLKSILGDNGIHVDQVDGAIRISNGGLPLSFVVYVDGTTTAEQVLFRFVVKDPFTFTAASVESEALAGVASTGAVTYSVRKNGVEVATFDFEAGETMAPMTQAGDVSFGAGDIFSLVGPASPDPTLDQIGFTFKARRV